MFAIHPQLETIFHPFAPAALYGPERLMLAFEAPGADEANTDEIAEGRVLEGETYEAVAKRFLDELLPAVERKVSLWTCDNPFL